MFALALWNKAKRTLLLARDRYGIKPLYYAQVGRTLLLGSEVKALLATGADAGEEMDRQALLEYFTFQNFFTDRTLFAGVRMLPAGCYAQLRMGTDESLQPHRYWDFNFVEPDRPGDQREYLEGARPPLPTGRHAAARQRRAAGLLPLGRHGQRLDHRHRRHAPALHQNVHLRLRPPQRLGPGTGLRRRKNPNS